MSLEIGYLKIDGNPDYFIDFDLRRVTYLGEILVINGDSIFSIYNPNSVILKRKYNSVYVLDKEYTELEIINPKGEFTIDKEYGEIWYDISGEIISRQTFRTKEIYEKEKEKMEEESFYLGVF